MTTAYQEIFLRSAMKNIGSMFDFAINDFGLDSDDFVQMFISSSICRRLELGDPKYLVGMSGVSLRSIQMYEQRNKDINKGQASTVMSLARALGCNMMDLLEA